MNGWLRSLAVLALSFVAVAVVTLGLANVIVPAGPADAPVILPPGIDPTLLLIGGAVLLAVLILK